VQDAGLVALALEEIAALLKYTGAPGFKIQAYETGAEVMRTVGEELGPLVEQGRLRELQGIGPAISRQIEEVWNTGGSEFLTRLRGEAPEGAAKLIRVEGLTPRRIRALHDALGVRSVEELRGACSDHRVRGVPGFGEKTEAKLLAACERWLNRGKRSVPPLLMGAALELATLLEQRLLEVVEAAHLAGALRRGEETVSELCFVIVGDAERALRHLLGLRQVLRADFAQNVAYLSDGVRLKLYAARAENLGTALFLATGSVAHLEAVRARAVRHDSPLAALDPSAVEPAGPPAAAPAAIFDSEAALYASLGLALIPAELREGGTEIEQAASGDFSDLVCLSDVQGMVHCHTSYSDGKNSIAEMALAAHALGMKYITITDHSPSAHYARGVPLDRLKQQWDEIAAAEERVPIRIFRGTEADILSDGCLDYPDAVLEQFEVVIASIHARHRLDRSAMTSRLVRAMTLPVFKIWGHALGRILNHRSAIDCDVPLVLDALARSRGAIELNADPHRLDLPAAWIPAARARGIPFVISVDAHSTQGFGVLRYGVSLARRGGLRRQEVLNTRTAESFAQSVRP
jgi:DNA polymerase (family 10)